MNLLELPDLVLELICIWTGDWVALRCCTRLMNIMWRPQVLCRLDLSRGVFCWRQSRVLHEIAATRLYRWNEQGENNMNETNMIACWVLGSMYFDIGDIANAWPLLNDYFAAGGHPWAWVSRRICIVGTVETITSGWRLSRSVIYVHSETCQHLRLAMVTYDVRKRVWCKIASDYGDAYSAGCNIKLSLDIPGVKYPLDSQRVVVANFVCNSSRLECVGEFSIGTEDQLTATDVLEVYIPRQSFCVMEIEDSVRRIRVAGV